MAIDVDCGGTIPVGGTTFVFMADSSGSGACPENTDLVFANVSSSPWLNLLVTASLSTALTGPLTCDPGAAFVQCAVTFDPSKLLYSALFFGEDSNHLGIPISMFIDGAYTHEFGFTFSGFPANQSFTADANVSVVPEPSTVDFMLGGFVLVLALSSRTRVLTYLRSRP
jgi:hypothetical protein